MTYDVFNLNIGQKIITLSDMKKFLKWLKTLI